MKLILHFKTFNPAWSPKWFEYIKFLIENHNWIEIDISKYYTKKRKDINDILPKDKVITHILFFNYNNALYPLNRIFKNISSLKMKKIAFFDDVHNLKKRQWDLTPYDLILTSVDKETFSDYFPALSHCQKYIPHGTCIDSQQELKEDTINKITLTGCINKEIYKGRFEIKKLHETNFKSKISFLKHPGYSHTGSNTILKNRKAKTGKTYYKFLSEHICSATSSGLLNNKIIIINKFFEIPATGSLLLIDKKSIDKLKMFNMKNMVHYLSYDENNADDIKNKINFITDIENRLIINKIRKNAQNLILNNHTTKHRANEINNAIKEL